MVPQNYQRVFELYSLAAESNYPSSLYGLGRLYANGHGVGKDFVKASELLHKAAMQNVITPLG